MWKFVDEALMSTCNKMTNGHSLNQPHPPCRSVLQLEQLQQFLMPIVKLVHVDGYVPLPTPI